jgi:hypothetical protein
MAISPAGCRLSNRTPGLHCGEDPRGQAGGQQGHLPSLRVNMDGRMELLGLWLSENEGAKFWLGF